MLPSSGLWICQFSHESLGEFTVVALFLVSWATCNYRANNSHDRGTWFIFGCAAAGCSSSRRPPASLIWLPQSLLSGGRKGLVQVYIHRCCGWLAVFLCWSVEFPLKRSGALDHVMLFLAKCRYGNGNIFGGFQSAWHWHHTSFIWRNSPVMMQFQWLTKKIAPQEWHRMDKVDKRMICKEISSR